MNNYRLLAKKGVSLFRLSSLLAVLFLVACASSTVPDKHFYVLSSYQYNGDENSTMKTNHPKLSIRSVKLPYYLDQQGIVRLKDNGRIVLSSQKRWGEKLSQSIPLLLSKAMTQQLKAPVEVHPLPPGVNVEQSIDVIVSNFVANDTHLLLSANYRISGQGELDSYQFNHKIPLKDGSIRSVVDAYAKGVYDLSTEIITKLN